MGTCLRTVTNGSDIVFVPVDPQPTETVNCVYVLPTGSDLGNSPWSLSVEDASLVGASIIAVWGFAWAFKALFMTVGNKENDYE